ncbi:hypothetical protein GCM10012278_88220 [Nonomuraea glycinis]|uniref:Uncharacterized protein n=1 Tax=Nonomuraea glycinis TaxID=2047744 RepID=A0A918EAV2_9ACTN|nr:hypothetical protein GCM10012278_88220 [Nonomuraea glycinis]
MQRIRVDHECFLEDTVTAYLLKLDAEKQQAPGQVVVANGLSTGSGLPRDQNMAVGRMRPLALTIMQPVDEGAVRELGQLLVMTAEPDLPPGQVDVVKGQMANGTSAHGVDGGQGDDQSLFWRHRCLLDFGDLRVRHGLQHARWRSADAPAAGWVGEDQAVAPSQLKQGPQCGEGAGALVAG